MGAKLEVETSQDVDASSYFIEVANGSNNLLPILPVKICLPNTLKTFTTHASLNPVSTTSFISDDLISKLNKSQSPSVEISTITVNKCKAKSDI